MDEHRDSFAVNLANWEERAPAHAASASYGFDSFVADPEFLSNVVRFDVPRLGDISGLRGVHLQCHIGTDTISLSRLGARMTGLDFSPTALREARRLAAATGADVDFVESDFHNALEVLPNGAFDLVFTGIGALCWLPDIRRWAAIVATLLRPGGRLFLREAHPMMWAIDERITDRLVIGYPYFETPEPVVFEEEGTYVETDVEFTTNVTHSWNHGIGELITALLDEGMTLTQFVEHTTVPWEQIPGQLERVGNEFQLVEHPERLPLTYTLQAVKPV